MTHEAQVDALESRLNGNPGDMQAMRRLVTILDQMPAGFLGNGRLTTAQRSITSGLPDNWRQALLSDKATAEFYASWIGTLHAAGITRSVPIGQIFAGRTMTINGIHAHCGERLKFFAKTGVISGLCNDCYKVQILPDSLEALIRVHFLLINMNLPNDNARKCMIELRDGIKFPYKAYIYCESVTEAQDCLKAFRNALADIDPSGIRSQISHGCSEYGQAYPAFKYDQNATDVFQAPSDWRKVERDYFRDVALTAPKRVNNSKPLISLRDVFAFRTWAKYAELIGDPSAERFKDKEAPELPPVFVQRVAVQSSLRRAELRELHSNPS